MKIAIDLIKLLGVGHLKSSILLSVMIVVTALIDVFGIASIMPFIAVLSSPELIDTNPFLNRMFLRVSVLGIHDQNQFLLAFGGVVFFLLILSLLCKALTTYSIVRFSMAQEHRLGMRLAYRYLQQPYSWFLERHSSELSKNILSEVGTVIRDGVIPLFSLTSQVVVTLAILFLLVAIDPWLALVIGLTLATAYIVIFWATNSWLARLGAKRVQANKQRFKTLNEVFSGIKEVIFRGLQPTYLKQLSESSKVYTDGLATTKLIAQLPRFALEALSFGGLLLVILYLMLRHGSFDGSLPTIALYAFAGYRLLPALQQIFASAAQLRSVGPAVDIVSSEINSTTAASDVNLQNRLLVCKKQIVLDDVTFRYSGADKLALDGIKVKIRAGEKIGFVGPTGSGKSTLADIILRLLDPSSGSMVVDDQLIKDENKRDWQRSLGYVPQNIVLFDDTVAANIAIGTAKEHIDPEALERAARIACIHDYIVSELPGGYDCRIGERGVRLSGGERQRLGIARAVYQNPSVLILDEATSALDTITEKTVIDAVNNLQQNVTLIMIAHRLSTVRKCDQIYLLDHGKIVANGTFSELVNSDAQFKMMAQQ